MTWCEGRYTSTMLSQPKSQLMASLSLCLHLNHPCLLQDTSRGVFNGLKPGQQFLLNQPPLPQSPPSQPPRSAPPRLPRVGPPHAHQPIRIRLPALSHGHQPLLGGPMKVHGGSTTAALCTPQPHGLHNKKPTSARLCSFTRNPQDG